MTMRTQKATQQAPFAERDLLGGRRADNLQSGVELQKLTTLQLNILGNRQKFVHPGDVHDDVVTARRNQVGVPER